MTQPPRIATWMLKHFGSGPDNDTLLGDLAEQYQRNGSALWYWRQALKAIPVSLLKEIRAHKWIAASALLTGWVVLIIGEIMGETIIPHFLRGFYYLRVAGYHVPYFWNIVIPLLIGALTGGVIGRFHRSQRTGAVLLFAVSVIFMGLRPFAGVFVYFYYGGRARDAVSFAIHFSVLLLGILLGGGLLFGRSNKVAVEG